jgi:hypothetical protein
MKFETNNNPGFDPILEELKKDEESYRLSLEEANKFIEEGSVTPSVIDDMQARYILAKQALENYEKSVR